MQLACGCHGGCAHGPPGALPPRVARPPQESPDGEGIYATQIAFLRDHTTASYLYTSPVNDAWMRVDVAALADAQESRWFPVGVAAPERDFAVDVAGGAVAASAA